MSAHDERRACCAEPGDLLVLAGTEDPGPEDAAEVVSGPTGPEGRMTLRDEGGEFAGTAHSWRIWQTQGEALAAELMG